MSFAHELGSKVKSKVTGFEGVLTSRSENLYGCNRYFAQPHVDKDGKIPDAYWFDEADIVITEAPAEPKVESERGGHISKVC